MRFECVSFVAYRGQLRFAIEAGQLVVPNRAFNPMLSHTAGNPPTCGYYHPNPEQMKLDKINDQHYDMMSTAARLIEDTKVAQGQHRRFVISDTQRIEVYHVPN